MENIVLQGKHVILREMTEEDAEQIYAITHDEQIWTYMPIRLNSLEETKDWIKEALQAKSKGLEYPFVIIDRKQNKIVGCTRYMDKSIENRGLEIGWTWYHPSVWRTAINTECKYLLLEYAFERLNCIRVQLKTDERNIRSRKAILRLGAKEEGLLRNHRILPDGFYRNTVMFSIVDTEWSDVKENLLVKMNIGEV